MNLCAGIIQSGMWSTNWRSIVMILLEEITKEDSLTWFHGRVMSCRGYDNEAPEGIEEHIQGYDYDTGECLRIVLDGMVYVFTENLNDRYSTCYGETFIYPWKRSPSAQFGFIPGPEIRNVFGPIWVRLKYVQEQYQDIIVARDVRNNKEIFKVGTDQSNDYYPWFVAEFFPQNVEPLNVLWRAGLK